MPALRQNRNINEDSDEDIASDNEYENREFPETLDLPGARGARAGARGARAGAGGARAGARGARAGARGARAGARGARAGARGARAGARGARAFARGARAGARGARAGARGARAGARVARAVPRRVRVGARGARAGEIRDGGQARIARQATLALARAANILERRREERNNQLYNPNNRLSVQETTSTRYVTKVRFLFLELFKNKKIQLFYCKDQMGCRTSNW